LKYFIIAGETSGDLHGSKVVKELQQLDKHAVFKGVGGNYLQQEGVSLIFGLERLSFMGFVEVVKNIFTIIRNFRAVKKEIKIFEPDIVLLIDYPGFNLRMAKWCKQNGIKVAYYISPTIWAWHESRVHTIKKYVDVMLCILPFEKAFYLKHHYTKAYYVGHPLMDEILVSNREKNEIKSTRNSIALLPGSRNQEINKLLPILFRVCSNFPNEHFLISAISPLKDRYLNPLPTNAQLVFDNTYAVLEQSKAAVVCSGTATLETALFRVPQVVVYKTSWINYFIGKLLIKVKFISLPNLIAEKKIIQELIQDACSEENINIELNKLLQGSTEAFYKDMNDKLEQKNASKNVAKIIFDIVA